MGKEGRMKYAEWKKSLDNMSRKELLEESLRIWEKSKRVLRIQLLACAGSLMCSVAIMLYYMGSFG